MRVEILKRCNLGFSAEEVFYSYNPVPMPKWAVNGGSQKKMFRGWLTDHHLQMTGHNKWEKQTVINV